MTGWGDEIAWKRIKAGRYVEPITGMEIQRVKDYWQMLVPSRHGGLDPAGSAGSLGTAKKFAALDVKVRRLIIAKAHEAAISINEALTGAGS